MTRLLTLAMLALIVASAVAHAETETIAVPPSTDDVRTIDVGHDLSGIRSVQLRVVGDPGNPVVVCMPDTIFERGRFELTVTVGDGGGTIVLPTPEDLQYEAYMDFTTELTPDPVLGWSGLEDGVFSYEALLEPVAAPEGCSWWSLIDEGPMFGCWLIIDYGAVDTKRDSWDGIKARYR